jgi:hypothetical protein
VQLLQADPHGACADGWLTEVNPRAVGVAYFHRAEGRFQVLSEEKYEFARRTGDRAANAWLGVVEKRVGMDGCIRDGGKQYRRRNGRNSHDIASEGQFAGSG